MDVPNDETLRLLYDQSLHDFAPAHTCQFCEKIVIDFYANRWRNWIGYYFDRLFGYLFRLRKPPSNPFTESRWQRFWLRFWWVCPHTALSLDTGEAHEALSHSCPFYTWFFGKAGDLQRFGPKITIPLRLDYTRVKSIGRKSLVAIRWPKLGHDASITLSSYQQGGEAKVCSVLPIGYSPEGETSLPPLNPSPCSEYSFALAQRWLSYCKENHRLCRATRLMAMPKRLIHIPSGGEPQVSGIRLVTCSERVDYAALSYCWGGPQPYMTTKPVIEKSIDLAELGQTIQDAITVTKRLGLNYLWVDAICIAQHDDSEKAIEIGKMADIYQGSYITISAARAASYQEGFLSPYDTDHGVQVRVKVRSSKGELDSIILYQSSKRARTGNDFGPVMDRAWCLQEHILAPRVLIYTSSILHFCCRTHNRSDSMDMVGGVSSFQPTALATIQKGGKTTMEAWQSTVAEFAKRSITVESDRLPAISAVAQVCGDYLGSKYVAGLWTERFYQQLAWSYNSYQDRQDAYYGPTFSWVALKKIEGVPAALQWSTGGRGSLQLLRVLAVPTSLDAPFGAVDFAGAYVRGRMKQAVWYPQGPRDNSAAAYFGLTIEKALRSGNLVQLDDAGREHQVKDRPLPEYANRSPTHQIQGGESSDGWETDDDSGEGDAIDQIIADDKEYLYSPAMLSEHADGRALADMRYKDNVPWVRAFCDTYEDEAALDRKPDTATVIWCLELFAPGQRRSGLCDGLLLACHKVNGEDVFTRIGYYMYPSKDNGQFIELDRRFLDDFQWLEFRLH